MSIENNRIVISGIDVNVIRKEIKNLHLGVYPPYGHVRVAAPLALNNNAVRTAVISRLGWIRRQQSKFKAQPRESQRQMVNGESHYFLGRRYRLRLIESPTINKVQLRKNFIELYAQKGASRKKREQILRHWYRNKLKELVLSVAPKWESKIGVKVSEWRIKQMKTQWGTCNSIARRIWMNQELIKKPMQCIEYIISHEMTHLIRRNHDERFIGLISQFMPQWKLIKEELSLLPVSHAEWRN